MELQVQFPAMQWTVADTFKISERKNSVWKTTASFQLQKSWAENKMITEIHSPVFNLEVGCVKK